MTTKQKVENKIRELVPRLQELSLGCRIHRKVDGYSFNVVDYPFESNRWGDIGGSIKTTHDTIEEVVVARNCAVTDDELHRFNLKDIEIIGHPIHLEDVLEAVGIKSSYYKSEMRIQDNKLVIIEYIKKECDCCYPDKKVRCDYNLSKPFSEQSEEVYKALDKILN